MVSPVSRSTNWAPCLNVKFKFGRVQDMKNNDVMMLFAEMGQGPDDLGRIVQQSENRTNQGAAPDGLGNLVQGFAVWVVEPGWFLGQRFQQVFISANELRAPAWRSCDWNTRYRPTESRTLTTT